MFCENCGTELPDFAKFCGKCGRKISFFDMDNATVLLDDGPTQTSVSNPTEIIDLSTEVIANGNATALLTELLTQTVNDNSTEIIEQSDTTMVDDAGVQGISKALTNVSAASGQPTIAKKTSENAQNVPEQLFGTYRVLNKIGQGGGGIVYKAIHTRLQKEVVIKQIKNPNGIFDRNETDMLKGIKHSYLPQVLDFIEQDGEVYTIIDFISGSDIDKLVKGGRKFTAKEIIRISKQLCEAVSYLHSLKPPVIHSDIKPANVMLSDSGDICLIDFNVSLVFSKNASAIGGTRGYAAPEQMGIPLSDIGTAETLSIGKNTPTVNARTDVYSIGAFMYFMITGQSPAADYRIKPISEFKTNVPDGLVQVVSTAMSLAPGKRYKSAAEMLTAIKNISKFDRRYKALKVRRAVAVMISILLTCGFAMVSVKGVEVLGEEHEEKYQGYISEIRDNVSAKAYDNAQSIILTASEFEPTRIEPYFNQSVVYYAQNDWEKCAAYPDSVITPEIKENPLNDANLFSEMYAMAAESAFELEDYQKTIELFVKAESFAEMEVDYYRDTTIAYARLGDIDNANKALDTAEKRGISSDKLELMQGEISVAEGDIGAAYECFVNAIKRTDDEYIRFRSLLACDKALLADGSDGNAEKMVTLLESELEKVSDEYSDTVKEMLANEYSEAGDYENAAAIYGELMQQEKLIYSMQKNYYNLLYSKLRRYDECKNLLDKMKFENAEDYWVDMNYAFLYISIENAKNQTDRDYKAAADKYNSAVELYSAFVKNGRSDPNMDNLTAAVNELKSYGWIKG